MIGSESSLLFRVDKAFSCAQCPLKSCASRGGIRLTRLAGGAGESIGGGDGGDSVTAVAIIGNRLIDPGSLASQGDEDGAW